MADKIYDFIVVGSGPAGSALAFRLASSKAAPSVLLLEAGKAKDPANNDILAERWTAFFTFLDSNWNYTTVPQRFCDDRNIGYARGKVLGGSSAINMCAYTVGPRDDYDKWAEIVGDDAFNWASAVKFRKMIEAYDDDLSPEHRKYAQPDMSTHGTNGRLSLATPKVWESPMTMQLEAAKQSELGFSFDINSGDPLGLASTPSTAKDGRRVTAAKAYLDSPPSNLTIVTERQVSKVILEQKKAVGVMTMNGEEYRAKNEVILSAGAVDTPKILMLSGIGDETELSSHKIDTIHQLPGVGNNMQDHIHTPFSWKQKDGLVDWTAHFSNPDSVKDAHAQFLKDGTGPLSVFFQGLTIGFFKADEVMESEEYKSLPEDVKQHIKKPTVPIWELSCHVPPMSMGALSAPEFSYFNTVMFLHCPQSRGTIRLASSNPSDAPLVDPNFFSHPFDRVCALAATRRTLEFVKHPIIADTLIAPVDFPASTSDEDILAYWRKTGNSTWHASCTVKMGKEGQEGDVCVNPEFKVRGLTGLRVVDLSVLPFLLNCHPVSVAYLVGEIAAAKMTKEYGLDG